MHAGESKGERLDLSRIVIQEAEEEGKERGGGGGGSSTSSSSDESLLGQRLRLHHEEASWEDMDDVMARLRQEGRHRVQVAYDHAYFEASSRCMSCPATRGWGGSRHRV